MERTTRAEAKARGLPRYFTGLPCTRGHVAPRRVKDKNCVACQRERKAEAYSPEAARRYYNLHIERIRGQWPAMRARRRAAQAQRTPSWLNQAHVAEVEGLYQFARLMEQITGQKYHVDHIVPLRGKTVSGLHVPWNLQVLRATDNLKKGNRVQSEGHPGAPSTTAPSFS